MYRMKLLALAPVVAMSLGFPLAAQGFGTAAALGDREVFLSEPNNPYAPGAVYVYRSEGTGWREASRLNATDGSPLDRFGRSLSYSGGRLLIGATSIDNSRGAGFIFERDGTGAWRQTAKLVAGNVVDGDAYGRKVLLDGDVAYVASWGRGQGQGDIRVWRRGGSGAWTEGAGPTAGDGKPGDFFGSAMSLQNNRFLVTAATRDTNTGTAYVFERGGEGIWTQTAQLNGEGVARGSSFGVSALLDGDIAFVGAPGVNNAAGTVFMFRRSASGSWEQAGQLTSADGAPRSQFGTSVGRVGAELWVGAPGADNRQGAIYRFSRNAAGAWTQSGKETHQALKANDGFGGMIAAGEGGAVAVGLINADYGMGAAVLMTRSGDHWAGGEKLFPKSSTFAAMTGTKTDCTAGKVGIFGCNGVDMLSFLPISSIGGSRGVQLNDIWGWTDPQTNREYALVGRIDGTSFVDVTDPVNPRYLGDLPKTEASSASGWRDIKVYKDHAYIVADGAQQHGMQVFDLARLRGVRTPQTFTPDLTYDRIASAHNIVIDTLSGYAFAVGSSSGGETCGGALHMIDIREPKSPKFAGCFADAATGRQKTGYTHDAQCVVYQGPDATYRGRQICFNSSETAIGIADVTDKATPKALSNAAYPNVAYTHQGWLTDDHRYFYVNDEGDEQSGTVSGTRTLIWDVSDLDDPVLVKEYISDVPAIDHNLYIKGNLMYQSNYTSGLRIFDISDPINPAPVGFFDTMPLGPDAPTFNGSWSNYPFFKSGTIIVSSIGEGLFILKKSEKSLVP